MIIKINEQNKVVMAFGEKVKHNLVADGKSVFEVESVPSREADENLFFNPDTQEFHTEKKPESVTIPESVKVRMEAQAKKANAMKWLTDNDWKVNKRTLGEWAEDDERWTAYLESRAKARAAIDAADAVLNA